MMVGMAERTPQGSGQPASKSWAVHIPPEEAVTIAFFAIEVAASAAMRQRNSLSMRLLAMRRDLEFAIAHEGGFRMLLRNSKYLSKFL
jgi:hypothetical protein